MSLPNISARKIPLTPRRWTFALLAALLAGSALAAPASIPARYEACRKLHQSGQLVAVEKAALEYVAQEPGIYAQLCSALAQGATGEFRKANEALANVKPEQLAGVAAADYHYSQALALQSLGQEKRATRSATSAIAAYSTARDNNGRALTMLLLTFQQLDNDNKIEAEKTLADALALCQTDFCKAEMYHTQGHFPDNPDESIKAYEKALAAYQKLKSRRGVASAQITIGGEYLNKEDLKKAERYAKEALEELKAERDPTWEANGMQLLAQIRIKQNKKKEARSLLEKAVSMARDAGANDVAKSILTDLNGLD